MVDHKSERKQFSFLLRIITAGINIEHCRTTIGAQDIVKQHLLQLKRRVNVSSKPASR